MNRRGSRPAPIPTQAATSIWKGSHGPTPAVISADANSDVQPSTKPNPGPNTRPTDQQLANAVVQYFGLVPGNLDAGWARLTAHFQRTKAQNRQTYDTFWHTVARVDVLAVRGEAPDHATATLRYHYQDGRVVTQRTRFRFLRQDGLLKIDGEN